MLIAVLGRQALDLPGELLCFAVELRVLGDFAQSRRRPRPRPSQLEVQCVCGDSESNEESAERDRDLKSLPGNLPRIVEERLIRMAALSHYIEQEIRAMSTVGVAPTRNRSVMGRKWPDLMHPQERNG